MADLKLPPSDPIENNQYEVRLCFKKERMEALWKFRGSDGTTENAGRKGQPIHEEVNAGLQPGVAWQ